MKNTEYWELFGMKMENKDSKYSVSAIGSLDREILESGFKKSLSMTDPPVGVKHSKGIPA